ncbi:MAG: F0F1 ATP synthase subunit delta [Micavibrio sp.]|nr:F0F1 ATP synthase subunit delta [Micavibrio sp.]
MSSNIQASSMVCGRYAKALIRQAESDKKLEAVEQDLKDLKAMIGESEDLKAAIRSPLLSENTVLGAMDAIADKAKFQTTTKNFLSTLVKNGRLSLLEKIIVAFEAALSEKRGEKKVDVKVAQDLSAAQKKELEAALSKAIGADVSVNVSVEPAILGGMIVTVGSKMIDNSVARKLERLRQTLGAQANDSKAA